MPLATDKQSGLTAAMVRERLDYDLATGALTWRARLVVTRDDKTFNIKHAGNEAGCLCPRGYRYLKMRPYGMFAAGRLIWLHVTGEWPPHEIDHADGDPSNNAWANLRSATRSENGANRGRHKNNKSGYKGVSFSDSKGGWITQVALHKKVQKLGPFSTAEQAHAAYIDAATKLHGQFVRLK